ncbi:hybrid sensor histidine kinase/response regulator transcription factor [Lewinella sp. W8]|uniref:hybrid sensor histidine kinase/response regulator transcription factor n=1 Tax=Lewinella sp. W8 TaxID=2528208 RepID=UPI001564F5CD|nr:hybrid sensor histidine kinase/response regulator transcription factor [Lewinella sp. W8]
MTVAAPGRGQLLQPEMDAYTYEDGLGSEAINDVLIDRFGYVWTAAYSGLHRFDGYDFLNYPADINDSCTLSHPIAVRLLEDHVGNLWVGTKAGLNRLDRTTNCFRRFFAGAGEATLPGNDVRDLALDGTGLLYVLTDRGLGTYQPERENFRHINTGNFSTQKLFYSRHHGEMLLLGPEGVASLSGNTLATLDGFSPTTIFSVAERADTLILGTNRGLFRWVGGASRIETFRNNDPGLLETTVLDLESSGDQLWMASRGRGLGLLSPNGNLQWHTNGLTDQHVRALCSDQRGNLWIGTYVGLNRRSVAPSSASHYRSGVEDSEDQMLEIGADHLGGVLFYLRWSGLYRAPEVGAAPRQLPFPRNDFLNGRDLNHILPLHDGEVLLSRGYDGLYRYAPERDAFQPKITSSRIREVSVTMVAEDARDPNLLWLASDDGLGSYHRITGEENWFYPDRSTHQLAGFVITSVLPGPEGKIWLSCGDYYNDRLGYFDPQAANFHFLDYRPGSQTEIAGGRIKQLAWGANGALWAAASQGLIGIDTLTLTTRLITEVAGKKVGIPESILSTPNGELWFGAGDRLGIYSPGEGTLLFRDATAIQQFSNAVSTTHPDGRLIFGGQRGIIVTDPSLAPSPPSFPPIVLNELRINGENHNTSRPLPDLQVLELSPRQRSLTLTFSALQYEKARKVQYAYRLGSMPEWERLGTEKSLSFTQLPPGAHRLQLRSDDGQGNWNQDSRELLIIARPALVEQWWFRLLLILLTLAAAALLARSWFNRKIERREHAQLVELDAFKSRLFANLTHEFRTPLTLILGPARRLLRTGQERSDPTLAREARRIDRQGKRLLRMINQLLDLQKLEAGQMKLYESRIHPDELLREIIQSFAEEAGNREVLLTLDGNLAPNTSLVVDRDKLESIIVNLVANGLRFSPPGSTLRLEVNEQPGTLVINVRDQGPGISAEDQRKIFDRYVQANDGQPGGTGIGLALVKELTQLMGGSIQLSSTPGSGSTFSVRLPRRGAQAQDAGPIQGADNTGIYPSMPPGTVDDARALVLIVEDDAELSSYLEESLADDYRIVVAPDGVAGVAAATELIPDLVISDVMMPNLNGYQLCTQLKADERTSHLPVLLLTAKSADEHRLEGLERGADAYLSKPFSERELRLRLRNLLHLRDRTAARLREEMLDGEPVQPAASAPDHPEANFLARIREYVRENISDTHLSVSDLERVAGMSRSQLHRKLQSTIGLSASKFINQLRLQAAAQSLRHTELSISNIAYDCGFQDPGYFGKKFRERYGCTPSEWRQGGQGGAEG